MSCFKIINLEVTSNRLSNPLPYIHRIWGLILLKYGHLLPFSKTCLGKRKTQFTVMSYFFLCLPISSPQWLPSFLKCLEKEEYVSNLHISAASMLFSGPYPQLLGSSWVPVHFPIGQCLDF